MAKHYFLSTADAYDAVQCVARVKTGDTLIIVSEGVVGVATTWPFAVTSARGALHAIKPGVPDAVLTVAANIPPDSIAAARACVPELQDLMSRRDERVPPTEWFHTEGASA